MFCVLQVFQRMWYHVRHVAMSRQQTRGGAAHPNSALAACLVEEDADVTAERERIEHTGIEQLIETDALILHGMCTGTLQYILIKLSV